MKKLIPFLFLFVPLAVWAGTITLNGSFNGSFTFTEPPAVDMGGFVAVDTDSPLVPTTSGGRGVDEANDLNGTTVTTEESTPYGNATKIVADGLSANQGVRLSNLSGIYFDFTGGIHMRIGNRGITGTTMTVYFVSSAVTKTFTFPETFVNGDYLDIKITAEDLASVIYEEMMFIRIDGTSANTWTVQYGA